MPARYLDDADAVLAGYDPAVTLGSRERKLLLTQVVDLVLAHPAVAAIVVGDISWRSEHRLDDRVSAWGERFTALLVDGPPEPGDRLVVSGILGAVVRSATSPTVDRADPATRATILQMATTLARLLPARGRAASTGPHRSPQGDAPGVEPVAAVR